MYQEGELNTVTMGHGTQSVLMAGTPLERRLELSAMLLATTAPFLVGDYILCYYIITLCSITPNSALLNFGRGNSSLLKWSTECDALNNSCSKVEIYDQCRNVIGIDCKGMNFGTLTVIKVLVCSSLCFKLST